MSEAEGLRLKAQGQAQVWRKEDVQWRSAALSLLYDYAVTHPVVRADEFRQHGGCLGEPRHPNAWGSLYTAVAKKGWLVKSRQHAPSKLSAAHAHSYTLWFSRVCPVEMQRDDFGLLTISENRLRLEQENIRLKSELKRVKARVVELEQLIADIDKALA